MKRWIDEVVVPWAGYLYIRLLKWTTRVVRQNDQALEGIRAEGGQYILAFWHSRFVMMRYVYPDTRIVVLISQHRDAQRLGKILERFGLSTAAGSSTRGGVAGMRQVLRHVRDGFDVGIAPDGPKGPRRRVKVGVITTARLTGLPIVPVTYSCSRAVRLRSWDRTLLPKPFGRGIFRYGDPIHVPRDADEAEEERLRRRLEAILGDMTDEVDREAGIGPEPPPAPEEAP